MSLSDKTIKELVENYWTGKEQDRHKAFPKFWKNVMAVLARYNCTCDLHHTCELERWWTTPPSFLKILQKRFSLEVEGISDALHHSPHLRKWYSPYQSDKCFGANYNLMAHPLEGENIFINAIAIPEDFIGKTVDHVLSSLRTDKPTRAVLLLPMTPQIQHILEPKKKGSKVLEIATFLAGSFPLIAPDQFLINPLIEPKRFTGSVGLFLAANRASLKIDPIDWEQAIEEIIEWSKLNKTRVQVCESTLLKFQQRIIPTYAPRAYSEDNCTQYTMSSNFFHFYDFTVTPENEANHFRKIVQDPSHLRLISRMNQHNRLAGCLGILPNQFIGLIQDTNPKDGDAILEDLRFTTFWATYSIWKKRQKLARIYWNDVIPDTWKIRRKYERKQHLGKHLRQPKELKLEDCINPFHYLKIRSPNIVHVQDTCNCSMSKAHTAHQSDIKQRKKQKTNDNKRDTGMDFKHMPKRKLVQPTIDTLLERKTSADICREEQDRKKRFKPLENSFLE